MVAPISSSFNRPTRHWWQQKLSETQLARAIARKIFEPRGPESGPVFLNQRRVFILPTKSGFLLAALLIALLLGSINYSLSLGYGLTFLLAGIAWIGMFHTFRNLVHLTLRAARVDPVFAGDIAEFKVILESQHRRDRFAILLNADPDLAAVVADPTARAETALAVPVRTRSRGWQPMPRITLETSFPLGLWRAWSYWQPDLKVLTYPAPGPEGEPLPPLQGDGFDGDGHAGPGSEDFAGIRPYFAGDVIKHLAWKSMARQPGEVLLTKMFDGGRQTELWLDLAQAGAHLDIETALSRMTRWVLDCEASEIRYGLRLAGREIDPDKGEAHRARCLTLLAEFESVA